MVDRYFVDQRTLDRIRTSWLAGAIERYVEWLAGRGNAGSTVRRRVSILVHFGVFAKERGARTLDDLPGFVERFVKQWALTSAERGGSTDGRWAGKSARAAVEQMLSVCVPGFTRARSPSPPLPFSKTAPGFFGYLRQERGLRDPSIQLYRHNLRIFEEYLAGVGLPRLETLTPSVLSAFTIESGKTHSRGAMGSLCSHVRVFLRYLHREGTVCRDLSASVDRPRIYRLSSVPRSIAWEELQRVLEVVDRESVTGKRDLAMLLLLSTYGLRAREVAALSLDSIDWEADRLLVPSRKCGHSTAYPLSPIVGAAIVRYLRQRRTDSQERALFLCATPPFRPVSSGVVADRARHWLLKAGVEVRRPGSHTLRHSCARRLLEAQFPLKVIGDYLGHSTPHTTAIYSKIDLEALREVALSGSGERVL